MKDKPMVTRNKLAFTEGFHFREVITKPFPVLEESILATTDLIKSTPENIRKSWGIPAKDPVTSEYLAGIERIYSLPDTIEDEIPAVSQAFADKVKAMGGIMTAYGLICDPAAPVEGKRYMRLARALFAVMFSFTIRTVEDAEYRIRNHAKRNKVAGAEDPMYVHFAEYIKHAFETRHKRGGRKPVYALKINVPSKDLMMLEKAGDFPVGSPFKGIEP